MRVSPVASVPRLSVAYSRIARVLVGDRAYACFEYPGLDALGSRAVYEEAHHGTP